MPPNYILRSETNRMPTHYEILEVSKTAGTEQITKAYRNLARIYHPDKAETNNLSQEEATIKFQQIQEAYEILKDPEKRKNYDFQQQYDAYPEVYDYIRTGDLNNLISICTINKIELTKEMLLEASKFIQPEIITWLLGRGLDINTSDAAGLNALFYTLLFAQYDNEQIIQTIEVLLKAGIDVNKGYTQEVQTPAGIYTLYALTVVSMNESTDNRKIKIIEMLLNRDICEPPTLDIINAATLIAKPAEAKSLLDNYKKEHFRYNPFLFRLSSKPRFSPKNARYSLADLKADTKEAISELFSLRSIGILLTVGAFYILLPGVIFNLGNMISLDLAIRGAIFTVSVVTYTFLQAPQVFWSCVDAATASLKNISNFCYNCFDKLLGLFRKNNNNNFAESNAERSKANTSTLQDLKPEIEPRSPTLIHSNLYSSASNNSHSDNGSDNHNTERKRATTNSRTAKCTIM